VQAYFRSHALFSVKEGQFLYTDDFLAKLNENLRSRMTGGK
jgi:hypothetical protein